MCVWGGGGGRKNGWVQDFTDGETSVCPIVFSCALRLHAHLIGVRNYCSQNVPHDAFTITLKCLFKSYLQKKRFQRHAYKFFICMSVHVPCLHQISTGSDRHCLSKQRVIYMSW